MTMSLVWLYTWLLVKRHVVWDGKQAPQSFWGAEGRCWYLGYEIGLKANLGFLAFLCLAFYSPSHYRNELGHKFNFETEQS